MSISRFICFSLFAKAVLKANKKGQQWCDFIGNLGQMGYEEVVKSRRNTYLQVPFWPHDRNWNFQIRWARMQVIIREIIPNRAKIVPTLVVGDCNLGVLSDYRIQKRPRGKRFDRIGDLISWHDGALKDFK